MESKSYSEYFADKLDSTINYSEYFVDKLDSTINYSEYLAEAKGIERAEIERKQKNRESIIDKLLESEEIDY